MSQQLTCSTCYIGYILGYRANDRLKRKTSRLKNRAAEKHPGSTIVKTCATKQWWMILSENNLTETMVFFANQGFAYYLIDKQM